MTDFSAAAVRTDFHPRAGKHNMASRAFEALRTQRDAAGDTRMADSGQTLGFGDLLDIANPLQHIPVVSEIYRSLTGDSISGSAQVVGDTLYGGPLGLVSGIFSSAIQTAEGRSPGRALVAALGGETDAAQNPAPAEDRTDRQEIATAYRLGTPWRDTAPEPAKPVQQTAARTGSPPIPQLSPAGFNAILAAFGDDTATAGLTGHDGVRPTAGTAHAGTTAPKSAEPRLAAADPAPVPPSGFAAAMANGLDKYRSMMDMRERQAATR